MREIHNKKYMNHSWSLEFSKNQAVQVVPPSSLRGSMPKQSKNKVNALDHHVAPLLVMTFLHVIH